MLFAQGRNQNVKAATVRWSEDQESNVAHPELGRATPFLGAVRVSKEFSAVVTPSFFLDYPATYEGDLDHFFKAIAMHAVEDEERNRNC